MKNKADIFIKIVDYYLEETQAHLKDTSLTTEDFSTTIVNVIEESIKLGNIKECKTQMEAELLQLQQLQCPLCGSKVPKLLNRMVKKLKDKLVIVEVNLKEQLRVTELAVNKVEMYWEAIIESQLKQSSCKLLQELLREFNKIEVENETKH